MAHPPQPIPLFFWSEIKFIFKDRENYGDLLSKYLVEKISGRPVKWVHPKKQPWYKWDKTNYLAIGSIIHHANRDSIVWGSGIIDRKQKLEKADFRAVRGPQTRKFLLGLGYDCPEVYGDPALLLPKYYPPKVEKKYRLGIVPHYHDFKAVSEAYAEEPDILVIDMMTMDVEAVTRQFLQCERTISSSLHGLIVSHAYGIPSVWVEFSKKLFGDGIKFVDYLESVELLPQMDPTPEEGSAPSAWGYDSPFLEEKQSLEELEAFFEQYPALPSEEVLIRLQEGLLKAWPLEKRN